MKIKQKLRFVASVIGVALVCFGLVVYENNTIARVGASSANLIAPSYSVGSEYAGTITHQYVNTGDAVKYGQRLFELKSDQLTAALTSRQLKEEDLITKLASDGGIILVAQHEGIISEIDYLEGSFVGPGKTVAMIKGVSGVTVRASFELSDPQYSKLLPNTPMQVRFAGQIVTAKVSGISQQSINGHTFTVVTAAMPVLATSQTVYSAGTPVNAYLILDTNTLYQRLREAAKNI